MRTSLAAILAAAALATPALAPAADAAGRFGNTRWRHPLPLTDLCPLPGGRLAAADAAGGWVVWDAQGNRVTRVRGEGAATSADRATLAVSPDGRLIAVRRSLGVSIRDAATGDLIARLDERPAAGKWRPATGLAFSADGSRLATVNGSGGIWWWGTADGLLRDRWSDAGAANLITLSPDGRWVAVDRVGGGFALLTADGETILHEREQGFDVAGLAFSDTGRLAVAWTDSTTATEVRADELDLTRTPLLEREPVGEIAGPLAGLEWLGGRLRLAGPREARFVGTAPRAVPLGGARVARSANGRTFALREDGHGVAVLDSAGRPLGGPGHLGPVVAVAFTPDSRTVVTAGSDDRISIWDARRPGSGVVRRFDAGHGRLTACVLSPDGSRVATAGWDRMARVRRIADGAEVRSRAVTADGLAWLGDDGLLTVGLRGSYLHGLWNPDKDAVAHPEGLPTTASLVATTPDGRLVAAAARGNGQVVRVVDRKGGKPFRLEAPGIPEDVTALAVVADLDGTGPAVAVAASDGTVRLWRGAAESTPGDGLYWADRAGGGSILALAFSPGGHWLAAAGEDGVVRLRESLTGQEAAAFQAHDGPARAVAFSPDGRLLASGGADTTVALWHVLPPTSEKGEAASLWDALAGSPVAAREAMARLAADPAVSARFLRERLLSGEQANAQQVSMRIAELDAPTFAARQRAEAELSLVEWNIRPALQKALDAGPGPEAVARLRRLLAKVGRIDPPTRPRQARALEMLGWCGQAGRDALRRLADGESRTARAATTRLEQSHADD